MGNVKHTVSIDLTMETLHAEQRGRALMALLERIEALAGGISIGGHGGAAGPIPGGRAVPAGHPAPALPHGPAPAAPGRPSAPGAPAAPSQHPSPFSPHAPGAAWPAGSPNAPPPWSPGMGRPTPPSPPPPGGGPGPAPGQPPPFDLMRTFKTYMKAQTAANVVNTGLNYYAQRSALETETGAGSQERMDALGIRSSVGWIPFIGGSLGNALAAPSERRAKARESAVAQGQHFAGLQRQLLTANLAGGTTGSGMGDIRGLAQQAAERGMSLDEAVGGYAQITHGAGFAGSRMNAQRAMALLSTGASGGAIGGYEGQAAFARPGGRGDTGRALGLAMAEGLRGANLDRYLSAIASNTERMAMQGLAPNVGNVEMFLGRMAGTPGMQNMGLRGPEVASQLMQPLGGARDQLLSPFRQVGQAAVLARALKRGGSMMGGLRELEGMAEQGPMATVDALQGTGLKGDALSMMLMSVAPALRTGEAGALGAGLGGPSFGAMQTRTVSDAERTTKEGENAPLIMALDKLGKSLIGELQKGNGIMRDGLDKLYGSLR